MRSAILVLAAFLLLPSMTSAQERQGRGRGFQMGGVNPINVVLEHAAELQLTDEQKATLTEMSKALVAKNQPILDELAKMRESGTVDREAMMPKLQTLRANNDEAQGKLKDVLNAQQLEQANKFIEEARPARRGRGAA